MLGAGTEETDSKETQRNIFTDGDISCHDWGSGYISISIGQHSINCTLKVGTFVRYKVIFSKAD